MEPQNRNRRLPCSEWRRWVQVTYRFQLPPNQPYYALPRELSASIIMDIQDGVLGRLWFVDDADNCVRIRLWREQGIIYTSGKDVRRLVSLTTERADVGIQIQHLDQRVYYAQILTNHFMPLEPFPNDRYYAGRVLPGVVQNEIAWRFHVLFDDRRRQQLQREYLWGEVDQGNSHSVATFGSRTVNPWEQEVSSRSQPR
ncbi:hypothetical protein PIB30_024920 [Stylosanthes scabra]|uniref:Uncharacterized protein n=1 Tax=Stylosanthes scabra TaxID=79078 RepID=A0ABU6T9R9_9FABA|nr:hypothetical protein [Stylosanthes scabra]